YGHRGEEAMVRDLMRGLASVTRAAPLVLVLEDLHWGDRATVDLVAALAQQDEPARLLLIGTMRPADAILEGYPRRLLHLRWGDRAGVSELPLELLDLGATRDFLERRLGDRALAGELAPWVVERTDGNPLFMVAVVEHLIEERALRHGDCGWALADGALPRQLPPSLT